MGASPDDGACLGLPTDRPRPKSRVIIATMSSIASPASRSADAFACTDSAVVLS